jgi:hypothetical protein
LRLSLEEGEKILLGNGGDTYQFIWNIFHTNKFLEGKDSFFYTNYLGYPVGRELYFYTLSPFNSFFGAILVRLINLSYEDVYNFLVIFHFVFSAFSMFFLINYLTKNTLVSFITGLIYGFSPWNYARALGHLNLLSVGKKCLEIIKKFLSIHKNH